MKKLLLLSLILAFTASLNAQTIDKKWGFGGGAGAYGTLENGGIGIMPELYFSRYLSPRFDIMLKGDMGIYRTPLVNTLDLVNPFLNLRFKLSGEDKNLRPYLFAGPGYLWDNGTDAVNFDLGLGTKYYIKPAAALYLEAGYIRGIESVAKGITGRENLWKVTAGVELNFGKAKDADLDGVSDNKDKCPNTPAGVAVDEDGCPIDTDGDGVADYLDDCPTIAGLTSLKGCPDADGDGVADKDDKCPDTPKSVKVDAFGCPLDTDKDGVLDGSDKCANTPAGVAVDKDGCPIDTDGDGVADYLDDCPTIAGLTSLKGCPDADGDGVADKDDKCPDTPKSVKVDAFGCPIDTDKDGVLDGSDKCADTPAGVKVDKDGCPVDTDGDGTPDYLDKCPSVAGSKENNGCPEEAAIETVSPEMTIDPVYFEYDNSTIQKVEKAKIEKLVKLLKSNDTYSVDLTGNADSKGEEEYNMKLSERRINSVVKAITNSGVKASRISKQKPLGETKPAATNDTEEGRALNRRVTFEVIKTK